MNTNHLKLYKIHPSGVGGNYIEEATIHIYERLDQIISTGKLTDQVLENSLNISTAACLVFLVCSEEAMKTISEQFRGFFSIGTVEHRVINDSLSAEDLALYATPKPKPKFRKSALGYNEAVCPCGAVIFLQSPSTECRTCHRLHLPKGVVATTRPAGDNREYVFHCC